MTDEASFSHIINDQPGMVDVSHKTSSVREALAQAEMVVPRHLTRLFSAGDFATKKGPVFHTAIIAAAMAVKQTSSLIPFCHPISIDDIKVQIHVASPTRVVIQVSAKSFSRTGVEMEALTGASVAALTIYDMCKSISTDMEIVSVKLLKKTGGKHDKHA